ncbi:MAG: hypothetical protein LBC41_16245 [Clostridiales bacterium]|jgi:hypothetical protein|nr:hypothetical protein [Clostridiales bacterium]
MELYVLPDVLARMAGSLDRMHTQYLSIADGFRDIRVVESLETDEIALLQRSMSQTASDMEDQALMLKRHAQYLSLSEATYKRSEQRLISMQSPLKNPLFTGSGAFIANFINPGDSIAVAQSADGLGLRDNLSYEVKPAGNWPQTVLPPGSTFIFSQIPIRLTPQSAGAKGFKPSPGRGYPFDKAKNLLDSYSSGYLSSLILTGLTLFPIGLFAGLWGFGAKVPGSGGYSGRGYGDRGYGSGGNSGRGQGPRGQKGQKTPKDKPFDFGIGDHYKQVDLKDIKPSFFDGEGGKMLFPFGIGAGAGLMYYYIINLLNGGKRPGKPTKPTYSRVRTPRLVTPGGPRLTDINWPNDPTNPKPPGGSKLPDGENKTPRGPEPVNPVPVPGNPVPEPVNPVPVPEPVNPVPVPVNPVPGNPVPVPGIQVPDPVNPGAYISDPVYPVPEHGSLKPPIGEDPIVGTGPGNPGGSSDGQEGSGGTGLGNSSGTGSGSGSVTNPDSGSGTNPGTGTPPSDSTGSGSGNTGSGNTGSGSTDLGEGRGAFDSGSGSSVEFEFDQEFPESEIPESSVPESGSGLPESGLPESEIPEAELPGAEIPKAEELPEIKPDKPFEFIDSTSGIDLSEFDMDDLFGVGDGGDSIPVGDSSHGPISGSGSADFSNSAFSSLDGGIDYMSEDLFGVDEPVSSIISGSTGRSGSSFGGSTSFGGSSKFTQQVSGFFKKEILQAGEAISSTVEADSGAIPISAKDAAEGALLAASALGVSPLVAAGATGLASNAGAASSEALGSLANSALDSISDLDLLGFKFCLDFNMTELLGNVRRQRTNWLSALTPVFLEVI